MSDYLLTELNDETWSRDIEHAKRTYPHEYALPIEFPIIDAALWVYLSANYGLPEHNPALRFVRVQATHGSVHYIMVGGPPSQRDNLIEMATIEVRKVMEDTTYLAMTPKSGGPFSESERGIAFFDSFCRTILMHFLRWFVTDQERILAFRPNIKPKEDIAEPKANATAREHALWHHLKLEPQGIEIKEYAKQVALASQSLFNERKKLGITTPRGSKKRSKSK